MSRYRKILSKIWDDDKFPYLSADAQRLFFLHLTSPRSTPFLLYVEGEGSMADTLRAKGEPMSIPRVRSAKAELVERAMAWYAKDGSNLIFLPNALKHRENGPEGGNSLTTWCSLFNDLPRTPFLQYCIGHLLTIKDEIEHPLTLEFIKALAGPYPKGRPKGKPTLREPIGQGQSIQDTGAVEKGTPIVPFGTFGEFGRAKLTVEQHAKLTAKLNGNLDAYIERFDRWVNEAPRAKANGVRREERHAYESILAWFDRDVKEGKVKPKSQTPSLSY